MSPTVCGHVNVDTSTLVLHNSGSTLRVAGRHAVMVRELQRDAVIALPVGKLQIVHLEGRETRTLGLYVRHVIVHAITTAPPRGVCHHDSKSAILKLQQ